MKQLQELHKNLLEKYFQLAKSLYDQGDKRRFSELNIDTDLLETVGSLNDESMDEFIEIAPLGIVKVDNEQLIILLDVISDKDRDQDKINQAASFTSIAKNDNKILRSTLVDFGFTEFVVH